MRSKTGPTAVVDTNVWISAALSPHGAPAQVLRAILLRGLPVFSEATFAELASRLWKHKFDRYIDIETRKALLRDAQAAFAKTGGIHAAAFADHERYAVAGNHDHGSFVSDYLVERG